MEAAVRSSWELLAPSARQAAAQCTLFAGPFDVAAFEAVVEVPGSEPLALLEDLNDHSWVRLHRGRLHMFDALRRFAEPHLHDGWDRHAAWAMAQPRTLAHVDELNAVVERFVATEPVRAARAAILACEALIPNGHTDLAREVLERAAQAEAELPLPLRSELIYQRIDATRRSYHFDDCRKLLEQWRPVADAVGPQEQGRWWLGAGRVELHAGHFNDAEAHLHRAEARLGPHAPSREMARLGSALGVVRRMQGRHDEAVQCLRTAVAMHERCGTPHEMVAAMVNLAMVLQGRWPQMEQVAARTVAAAAELGAPNLEAAALSNLGLAQQESGQFARAVATFEACLDVMQAIGERRQQAQVLNNYALALFGLGDEAGAFARLDEARLIHHDLGNAIGHRITRGNRGILHLAAGHPVEAEADLLAAHATFEAHPHPPAHRSILACMLAALLASQGRVDQAEIWLTEAAATASADDPTGQALLGVATTSVRLAACSEKGSERQRLLAHAEHQLAETPTGWDHRALLRVLEAVVGAVVPRGGA